MSLPWCPRLRLAAGRSAQDAEGRKNFPRCETACGQQLEPTAAGGVFASGKFAAGTMSPTQAPAGDQNGGNQWPDNRAAVPAEQCGGDAPEGNESAQLLRDFLDEAAKMPFPPYPPGLTQHAQGAPFARPAASREEHFRATTFSNPKTTPGDRMREARGGKTGAASAAAKAGDLDEGARPDEGRRPCGEWVEHESERDNASPAHAGCSERGITGTASPPASSADSCAVSTPPSQALESADLSSEEDAAPSGSPLSLCPPESERDEDTAEARGQKRASQLSREDEVVPFSGQRKASLLVSADFRAGDATTLPSSDCGAGWWEDKAEAPRVVRRDDTRPSSSGLASSAHEKTSTDDLPHHGQEAIAILLHMHAEIRSRMQEEKNQPLSGDCAARYLGQLASALWSAQRELRSLTQRTRGRELHDKELDRVMLTMHQLDTADSSPSDSAAFPLEAPSAFYEALLATAAYLNDAESQAQASSLFAFSLAPLPALAPPPPPPASSYLLSVSLQDCIAMPRANVSLLTSLLLQVDVPHLSTPENRLKRALTVQLLQKFLGMHKIGKCIYDAIVSAMERASSCAIEKLGEPENAPAGASAPSKCVTERRENGADYRTSQAEEGGALSSQLLLSSGGKMDAAPTPTSGDCPAAACQLPRTSGPTAEADDAGEERSEAEGSAVGALVHPRKSRLLLFTAAEEEAVDQLLSQLVGRASAGFASSSSALACGLYSSAASPFAGSAAEVFRRHAPLSSLGGNASRFFANSRGPTLVSTPHVGSQSAPWSDLGTLLPCTGAAASGSAVHSSPVAGASHRRVHETPLSESGRTKAAADPWGVLGAWEHRGPASAAEDERSQISGTGVGSPQDSSAAAAEILGRAASLPEGVAAIARRAGAEASILKLLCLLEENRMEASSAHLIQRLVGAILQDEPPHCDVSSGTSSAGKAEPGNGGKPLRSNSRRWSTCTRASTLCLNASPLASASRQHGKSAASSPHSDSGAPSYFPTGAAMDAADLSTSSSGLKRAEASSVLPSSLTEDDRANHAHDAPPVSAQAPQEPRQNAACPVGSVGFAGAAGGLGWASCDEAHDGLDVGVVSEDEFTSVDGAAPSSHLSNSEADVVSSIPGREVELKTGSGSPGGGSGGGCWARGVGDTPRRKEAEVKNAKKLNGPPGCADSRPRSKEASDPCSGDVRQSRETGDDQLSGRGSDCKPTATGGAPPAPGSTPEKTAQQVGIDEPGPDASKEEGEEGDAALSDISANRLRGELRPACCYFMRSMCEFSNACVFWHPPATEAPEKIVCKYGRVCHANHGRLVPDGEVASIMYDFAKSLSSMSDGEMGRVIHYLRASRLIGLVGSSEEGSGAAQETLAGVEWLTSAAGGTTEVSTPVSERGREGSGTFSSYETAATTPVSRRAGGAAVDDLYEVESPKRNIGGLETARGSAGCPRLPDQVLERFLGLAERLQGRDLSAVHTAWWQTFGEQFPFGRYGFEKLRHALVGIPGVTLTPRGSSVTLKIDLPRLSAYILLKCASASAPLSSRFPLGKLQANDAPAQEAACGERCVPQCTGVRGAQRSTSSAPIPKDDAGAQDPGNNAPHGAAAAGMRHASHRSKASGAEVAGLEVKSVDGGRPLQAGSSRGRGKDLCAGTAGVEECDRLVPAGRPRGPVNDGRRLPVEDLPLLMLKVPHEQVVGELCSSALLCGACGLLLFDPLVHPRCGHMICRDCLVILSATHFRPMHRINFRNISTPPRRRHPPRSSTPTLAQVTAAILHLFPSPASLPLSMQSPSSPSFCPVCTYGEERQVGHARNALSCEAGGSPIASSPRGGASLATDSGGRPGSPQVMVLHPRLPRMLKPLQKCHLGEFLSAVGSDRRVPALLGRMLEKVQVRCCRAESRAESPSQPSSAATAAVAGSATHSANMDANGASGRRCLQELSDVNALRNALCKKHRIANPSEGCCRWQGDYARYLEHIRAGECGRLYACYSMTV
ncbi:hypothetical protein BESB_025280 [Besnoitia besnoiti]|uniref:C3H1-type domain-containing protein n=1 Tax=Besnoitia besnoiti TaxID=94643 RepID=A0A2A9M842_BESBE|nr:uncharacterized protein BESB_025280 [Besnoitia besnoiti]PFH31562.1 hypothetical protein BESB_025280 [Besnoitia besnoiti]